MIIIAKAGERETGAMLWQAEVQKTVWKRRDSRVRCLIGGSRNPFPHIFRDLGYCLPIEERLVKTWS